MTTDHCLLPTDHWPLTTVYCLPTTDYWIWAARRASPLVLGLGNDGNFLASDIPAFLAHTKDTVFIEDEDNFPSFAIDLADGLSGKLVSNLQEVRARSGPVLLLSSSAKQIDDGNYWELPKLAWPLDSFAVLPAIQLFAYEMAVLLGKDVDQPRNLAKSVTVE